MVIGRTDHLPGGAAPNWVSPKQGLGPMARHAVIAWGKLYYQVRWKSWDPNPQWYLAGLFKNSASLLKVYYDQYPNKVSPPIQL